MLTQRDPATGSLGVVIIGRNEGDRLRRCLESLSGAEVPIIYVDSGSSDGSIATSRAFGVSVVELDASKPFTAARARNEGFWRLLEVQPALDYLFFVDGDCEVAAGWLERARRFLDERPDVAVVCGRRRERHPERSIYNMLCDIEWDIPAGETKACGGDAVMRVIAVREVNGYRSDLICGEEPELCVRLRRAGWRVWRLGDEMTLHDAALYRFGQWWTRMLRGGYGFALGVNLHGAPPERHCVYEARRAWLWGVLVPLAAVSLGTAVSRWFLLLLVAYPLQVIRLARRGRRTARENWWRAGALVLGNFPEVLGQLRFRMDHFRRARSTLIEYK